MNPVKDCVFSMSIYELVTSLDTYSFKLEKTSESRRSSYGENHTVTILNIYIHQLYVIRSSICVKIHGSLVVLQLNLS